MAAKSAAKAVATGRQAEFEAKLGVIRAYLQEHGLGGVVFSTQALFAWATAGGDNHVVLASEYGFARLLVTPASVTVLATNIETHRVRDEEFKGLDASGIEFWQAPWHADQSVAEIQRRMGAQPWAGDSDIASKPLGEDFLRLTYSLHENEIARYRILGKDCSLAMEEALDEVRPGDTEYHVAGLVCRRMWDHAVRPNLSLVAVDERVFNYRHPIPTAKKLKKHLMAVLCGKRGGLIINVTRMLHCARKLPEDLRRKHDAVCAVDMALNAASRPGAAVKDVLAAGLAEYKRQGFPEEWQLHHQGGPTGYQGRSYLGTPQEERQVLANQAFAWNPSICGTKSEDTILARADGIEFLSAPTKSWPALPVRLDGKTYKRADIKLR